MSDCHICGRQISPPARSPLCECAAEMAGNVEALHESCNDAITAMEESDDLRAQLTAAQARIGELERERDDIGRRAVVIQEERNQACDDYRKKLNAVMIERDRLRRSLIDIINEVGGSASHECSTDFLCLAPQEVKARVDKLRDRPRFGPPFYADKRIYRCSTCGWLTNIPNHCLKPPTTTEQK